MKICVVGTGYVGLVTAISLADMGNSVVCIDIDKTKIDKLNSGECTIYEPGLQELMDKNFYNICFTDDYKTSCCGADIIFIAVGTPENADGSANLNYVFEATKQVASSVNQDCIVVVKSTVPIGTNDDVEKVINDICVDYAIHVVSNPEFLSQGTAVYDTFNASRIVIGTENEHAREVMGRLYEPFNRPILYTKRRSAEMIKYASNDFLALKISYINEIANLCEMIDADIDEVSVGMGYDARIGKDFLKAGIGYGGSCFPKDTKALHWLANINGYELKTIKAAIEVNEEQKLRLITKSRKYFASFKDKKVAILGVTFKPETDDLRESPALVNIPILLDEGADIRVWDVQGLENLKKIYSRKLSYCNTIDEAIEAADVCFIFTQWKDVCEYDINRYKEKMSNAIVFDGRNCYSVKDMVAAKIMYIPIGKEIINN